MKTKRLFVLVGGVCLITVLMLPFLSDAAPTSKPSGLPNTIYWAARDVGSGMHAISVTIADAISPKLGIKIRMVPGQSTEQIYLMTSKKCQLYSTAGPQYFEGLGLEHACTWGMGPQPVRNVWCGLPDYSSTCFMVTVSSGIKTPYDLKGKRIGVIPSSCNSERAVDGNLAFGKLTRDDATIVQFSSYSASYKGLAEGKIDACNGTNVSPGILKAAQSPYGCYLMRYPMADKEGWASLQKHLPFIFPGYITKGVSVEPGEKVESIKQSWPQIVTMADVDERLIYEITKAIYDRQDAVAAAYAPAKAIILDRWLAPSAILAAPMHKGSIKFFKEIGVWTDELEKLNERKLDQMARAKERWDKYILEAEKRVKAKEKIKLPVLRREWRKIVEDEIGSMPW